jgi:hypothetical protein
MPLCRIEAGLKGLARVPVFAIESGGLLKTVIPSRNATRDYLGRGNADAENR